jgi:hypothetical protein
MTWSQLWSPQWQAQGLTPQWFCHYICTEKLSVVSLCQMYSTLVVQLECEGGRILLMGSWHWIRLDVYWCVLMFIDVYWCVLTCMQGSSEKETLVSAWLPVKINVKWIKTCVNCLLWTKWPIPMMSLRTGSKFTMPAPPPPPQSPQTHTHSHTHSVTQTNTFLTSQSIALYDPCPNKQSSRPCFSTSNPTALGTQPPVK